MLYNSPYLEDAVPMSPWSQSRCVHMSIASDLGNNKKLAATSTMINADYLSAKQNKQKKIFLELTGKLQT